MIKNIELSVNLKKFLIYVESLNVGIESIRYDYSIHEDYKKRICSVLEDGDTRLLIGIQKIQYLREILKPLMIDKNISQLIHIISIAQFYSYLFYDDDYFNGTVDVSYVDKYSPVFLNFSIGVFNFSIYENNVKFFNAYDDYVFESSNVEESYNIFLNYIQQKISDHLHADIDHISHKNILLLEMLKI